MTGGLLVRFLVLDLFDTADGSRVRFAVGEGHERWGDWVLYAVQRGPGIHEVLPLWRRRSEAMEPEWITSDLWVMVVLGIDGHMLAGETVVTVPFRCGHVGRPVEHTSAPVLDPYPCCFAFAARVFDAAGVLR